MFWSTKRVSEFVSFPVFISVIIVLKSFAFRHKLSNIPLKVWTRASLFVKIHTLFCFRFAVSSLDFVKSITSSLSLMTNRGVSVSFDSGVVVLRSIVDKLKFDFVLQWVIVDSIEYSKLFGTFHS